jgi:NADPH:quinone reductase-like Zn-dependent oxidoreductase
MKAVRFHNYGGPEVLRYEDAPRPEPGPGDVLVRVHAAAVNPVDWKVRAGHTKGFLDHPLPFIPGWDFSGVVESVGPGVTQWKPGDEVYGRPDLRRQGTYAEYAAVAASEIAFKPKSLDHVHAAAIPLAALTAWQALFDAAALTAGQTILIHAAAGGVGHFAVQFAHGIGAHVIGTASARNHAFLKELGADRLIDYTVTKFEDAVHGADAVLDTMAGEVRERSWQVLKKDGILVTILGPTPTDEEAAAHGVRTKLVFVQPNPAQLAEIAKWADSGKLKPCVETVLPLSDAAKAHEMNETLHTRGKIVLKVV